MWQQKISLHPPPLLSYHFMPYQLLFPIHVSTSHHSDFSFLSKTFVAFMDIDPHAHLLHLRNFTYFSFFSELRRSDHAAATVVETLAISTVFLVSVAANAGAAALVTWERRLLANKTVLTLNLFAADLLFISMIPLIVAVRWTVSWTLGFAACHTVLYVICMSGSVTITTLASISVERVQAILRLQRVPTLNPRMVTATLIFIWAFSALTALPLSLFFTVVELDFPEQERVHICTMKWPDSSGEIVWNISFTALCFLLPGFIIVVSYSKILQIAKSCRRGLQTRSASQPPGGEPLEYHVSRQDMKLFRTLLVLVLSFLLMWSPIFINTFLILARNFFGRLHVSSTTFFWVITFTLTNSALNPILYSVFQFKSGLRKLCCSSAVVPLRRATRGSGRTQRKQP
ncbi:free fatty acid receptor 4-like [Scophthalmus maximus]|uniref:free fatty acid receptor 4-like n=1 Tax=Scophthalmus maximus TaxID=52904 RepID=UPI001FA8CC0C|nr:free fatty acid receptor 4-like [Scophthalmus maximus]